jgi:hypothetical protein
MQGEVLNATAVLPPSCVVPSSQMPTVRLASVTPRSQIIGKSCPLQDRTYKKKRHSREMGWLLRRNGMESDVSHWSCRYVCRVFVIEFSSSKGWFQPSENIFFSYTQPRI